MTLVLFCVIVSVALCFLLTRVLTGPDTVVTMAARLNLVQFFCPQRSIALFFVSCLCSAILLLMLASMEVEQPCLAALTWPLA
jgi:hypothetical protein